MLNTKLLRLPPGPREVHLWCLLPEEVQDASLLHAYSSLLCPADELRLQQAASPALKRERLLTQALLRTTLSRYCGGTVQPSGLEFAKNAHGKPEVRWPTGAPPGSARTFPKLQFNLSHTSSLIACAVTCNRAVGLDVEEVARAPKRDVLSFARRRFAAAEADWLERAAGPRERQQRFIQLWTLKEAYVKALGRGIRAAPLKDFAFRFEKSPAAGAALAAMGGLAALEDAEALTLESALPGETDAGPGLDGWQCLLLQPTPLHYASLCVGHAEDEGGEGAEGGRGGGGALQLRCLKTVPLLDDEAMGGPVIGLACTLRPGQREE